MTDFYPFQALRPKRDNAERVACLPYDVLSDAEARTLAKNPDSFVHVIRSEVDYEPGVNLYEKSIYDRAAENLKQMMETGTLVREETPCYFLYREITPTHTQTGFVGTVSCGQYEEGIIRRHELTVPEKEDDRTRHILACNAQTGPVFLTYPDNEETANFIALVTKREPLFDFENGEIRHQVWKIDEPNEIESVRKMFEAIPVLYIADGHHRAASSNRAAKERGAADAEEAGRFMTVVFPANDLSLLGYHRFVKDLNGMSEMEFLAKIAESFDVTLSDSDELSGPVRAHEIMMLLGDKRYVLVPHDDIYDASDSISRLDVSILQENLLGPVLGIEDPRRNKRIAFIGGKNAFNEMQEKVTGLEGSVGFLLYPTDIHDLIAVADDHRIMPPKSTWFEPKLLSGLFVHEIG